MRCRESLLFLLLLLFGNLALILSADPRTVLAVGQYTPEPHEAGSQLVLEHHDGRLSVHGHHVPWDVVLEELERYLKITIRVEGRIAGALNDGFEALPLEQGLRRLFRGADLVFLYTSREVAGAPGDQLTQIWLLPKEGSDAVRAQAPIPSPAATTERHREVDPRGEHAKALLPEPETSPASGVAVDEDPAGRLRALEGSASDWEALHRALLDPDQRVQARALQLLAKQDPSEAVAALMIIAKNEEPATRLQAFSLLHEYSQSPDYNGHVDQGIVLSVLGAAVADEDMGIKRYAIEALAGWGGPDAVTHLRQALHDPDPSVRTIVIEHVASQGENVHLLEEALSDADETVRAFAAAMMKQMNGERR